MPNLGHGDEPVALTKDEFGMLEFIAERDGISTDEAASRLVHGAMERRMRKRTGKTPAKVYPIKRGL